MGLLSVPVLGTVSFLDVLSTFNILVPAVKCESIPRLFVKGPLKNLS